MVVEDICAICLCEYEHRSTIPELNNACQHVFCQRCIVEYVSQLRCMNRVISCPLCRRTEQTTNALNSNSLVATNSEEEYPIDPSGNRV